MIPQEEPWVHRERGWTAESAAVSETLLALANGYLGIRGTLDEGAPAGVPGTYLGGFYETRTIPYADRGFGDPELDQVLIGVADGTRIRLDVEGEPLDVRTGTVAEHERALDLRAGQLTRTLVWRSPAGHEVVVRSRRLVSLAERELAAIEYAVEPTERALRVAVRSELVAELGAATPSADPRAGAALPDGTLVPRLALPLEHGAVLVHEARRSRNVVAAGADHLVLAAPRHAAAGEVGDSRACWSLEATVEPGRPLLLVKLLAYHWAPNGDPAELAAAVRATLERGRVLGFAGLADLQRDALDRLWPRADVELDGDDEIQHALRYALFQLHQNAARATGRAIPAKGLTGSGYNGHTFWDTEIFLLPVLADCAPELAAEQLRWRAATLPQARANARRLGLRGAAFPWRTIAGEECAAYLPAGSAALHVSAAVADAVVRYVAATGDHSFERDTGAPLLVDTARLWASAGHYDERGRFVIDGVTGPDEYTALVDNNLYTNLMAQANLRAAADVVERLGAAVVAADPEEVAAWRAAADAMTIPYDRELGIHLQDESFARHAPFAFDEISPEHYPLFLHVPYFQLYRRQVIKQPDLVLAMALHPEAFTPEQTRRNFAHYEALTVRDSSLSAGTEAVVAAEIGDVELAYDYLAEAALLDHHDLNHNTADGLHLAALAGGLTAVIAGLAGAREQGGRLSFRPRLPAALRRIAFPFAFRGRELHVEVVAEQATYRLRSGAPLELEHWDTLVTVAADAPATVPIPPAPPVPPLRQPPGRAPARRRPCPDP